MTPRRNTGDRTAPSRREAIRFGLGLGATALAALGMAGCDPRQAVYFLQPFEPQIKPPCPSLQGKTIAILARAAASTQSDYVALDQELAQRLAKSIRENTKKVEIIDLPKVKAWRESHPTSTDPSELAKAFDADVVIQLELIEFRIDSPDSPGMYAGHSRVYIKATELKYPENPKGKPVLERPKEAETIHEDEIETTFPRVQGSLPADVTLSRTAFRKRFLDVIGSEVSWHFVPHAPTDNVQNVRFNGE
ncbi:MAG: hypothetical protein U0800_05920 [Isosphaeraceae bacterium]